MRIACVTLIFCKVRGVEHLAYIVIESPCTYQLGISSYPCSGFRGQNTHLHRVLKSTRCYFRQLPEQGSIDVAELYQAYIAYIAKDFFNWINQHIAKH